MAGTRMSCVSLPLGEFIEPFRPFFSRAVLARKVVRFDLPPTRRTTSPASTMPGLGHLAMTGRVGSSAGHGVLESTIKGRNNDALWAKAERGRAAVRGKASPRG